MIEAIDLSKTYRVGFWRQPVESLRGATFTVREGDLYGFIGPNGAGKSTSIKILLGLLRADGGKALLMGKPAGAPAGRAEVGFLPEQPYFYDYLTGREFLGFYGHLSRLGGTLLARRINEAAEMSGVKGEWLDRKLRTYSKGMLQRIGLAQALIGKPRLVILDEPMSGLDPLGRRDVRNLLLRLHGEGVTVFYSSHVLADVEAICTRLAMVVEGQVRKEGTVSEVLEGESEAYRVRFAAQVKPGDVPAETGRSVDPFTVSCPDRAAQAALLSWALARGIPVESVYRDRPSLEDVLAVEVGKPH